YRPLNILGRSIMRLNLRSEFRKLPYPVIGETTGFSCLAPLNNFRTASSYCPDNNLFAPQAAFDNLAGRGIHHKMVGVGRAGDDRFTQSGIGIDHGLASLAG